MGGAQSLIATCLYRCRRRPCGRRVGGFKHEPSRVYRGIRGTEYRKRHLRQDSHAAWLGESPDVILIFYCRCPFETPSTVNFFALFGTQMSLGINRPSVCRRKTGTPTLHDDWPLRPTTKAWRRIIGSQVFGSLTTPLSDRINIHAGLYKQKMGSHYSGTIGGRRLSECSEDKSG